MTLEQSVEWIMREGYKAVKKNNQNTIEGRKLNRHEPIERYGLIFTCWREFIIYKVAMQLQEWSPGLTLEVELAGNDTTLTIDWDNKEQRRKLTTAIYKFLIECKKAGMKIE